MKSKNVLVILALLFLFLAITAFLSIWSNISAPVKIAFFAFGYGAGIMTGARVVNRSRNSK